MAFADKELILYNGTIKINYWDKTHRYYVVEKQADGSWGKARLTKGVTTMIDNTLEKKGLMTWPMGLALGELFGFYNFTNDQGEKMLGFSKGKGRFWNNDVIDHEARSDFHLEIIKSASEAWQRQKQRGADIGSIVHDFIERFVVHDEKKFITVADYKKDRAFDTKEDEYEWTKHAEEEVRAANFALAKFKDWWADTKPELLKAEELVYSHLYDYCGTYDGLLQMGDKIVLADWKTSNASNSRDAAAPEGVYYSYFIQLGFYERARREMGLRPADDLMIVSARKDGGFSTKLASEVGLTVQNCLDWADAVHRCYTLMTGVKKELLKGGQHG